MYFSVFMQLWIHLEVYNMLKINVWIYLNIDILYIDPIIDIINSNSKEKRFYSFQATSFITSTFPSTIGTALSRTSTPSVGRHSVVRCVVCRWRWRHSAAKLHPLISTSLADIDCRRATWKKHPTTNCTTTTRNYRSMYVVIVCLWLWSMILFTAV